MDIQIRVKQFLEQFSNLQAELHQTKEQDFMA